jgi:hypothetical protein
MSLTSESVRRSMVLAGFHHHHLPASSRLAFSALPGALRPMPESQARALLDSPPVSDTPAIAAARRAARCGFGHSEPLEGVAGSVICSIVPPADPRQLAGSEQALVDSHSAVATFDADALVTTATARLRIRGVDDDLWNILTSSADPRNWSLLASDFFKKSERLEDGLELGPNDGWRGRLHEVFEWNWNPGSTAHYENFLGIDYTVERSRVRVDYWLDECRETDLGLGTTAGGLDLDGGSLTLERDGTTVISTATKNLRYTDPPNAPDGFVLTVSFLTPAVLSVWLDAAVYNGALQSIAQNRTARGPAAGRGRLRPAAGQTADSTNPAALTGSPR